MIKVITVLFLIIQTFYSHAIAETKIIKLHAANSAVSSGVIHALVEDFETDNPEYKVIITKAGGISVLNNARQGLADLAITHYPDGEKLLIADGFATNRTYLMYNSFAIFGEADNELKILPSQDLLNVLQNLATEEAFFLRPGNLSATAKRLKSLWSAAGIIPDWDGYENTGASTSNTLIAASQDGYFAFSDMATYGANIVNIKESYIPLYRDNILLRNYYSIITLNPEKLPKINSTAADKLKEYLISIKAQTLIKNYGVAEFNHAIYIPASSLDEGLAAIKLNQTIAEKNKTYNTLLTFTITTVVILILLGLQYYRYIKLSHIKQKIDRRFKLAVEGSNDGLIDWNLSNDHLYMSTRMRSMIGLDKENLYGFEKDVLSKIKIDHRETIIGEFKTFTNPNIENKNDAYTIDCPFVLKDESEIWLNIRCKVVCKSGSKIPSQMVGVATDITQIKQQQFELEHQALHDALTDLPNRRLFEDRISQAISVAKRHKLGSSIAVLMLDLDNFKNINDTHGHQVGDEILRLLAASIQDQLREYDTVARLGGDEFGILLTHTDNLRANHIAQKLLLSFNRPLIVGNLTIHASGSIGIVMYPEHGETTETLIKHVDVAMYSAKKSRSGSQIYNVNDDSKNQRRLMIQNDLIIAIDTNVLEMHYQPKVNLRTKSMIGAEALLRWNHPTEGFINPEEIIEISEQTGIIRRLTEWVIESVFRQVAIWSSAGIWMPVSINLSVLNLQDRQLTDYIKKLLLQYNIEPQQIEFEITESAMMHNPEIALRSIAKISEMNIPLSIDDFGTGFSSMLYLKQLPVDALKIDKEFIQHIANDSSDQSIVRATIDLGHSFKLNVIAEGVEDSKTMSLLSRLGCDIVQGYFVSKPLRVAAFEKFMTDSPWALDTSKDADTILKIQEHNLH